MNRCPAHRTARLTASSIALGALIPAVQSSPDGTAWGSLSPYRVLGHSHRRKHAPEPDPSQAQELRAMFDRQRGRAIQYRIRTLRHLTGPGYAWGSTPCIRPRLCASGVNAAADFDSFGMPSGMFSTLQHYAGQCQEDVPFSSASFAQIAPFASLANPCATGSGSRQAKAPLYRPAFLLAQVAASHY